MGCSSLRMRVAAFDCMMAAERDVTELCQEAEDLVACKNTAEAVPILVSIGEFIINAYANIVIVAFSTSTLALIRNVMIAE